MNNYQQNDTNKNSPLNSKVQKLRQEIVIKMNDGSIFCGRIFIGFNERVLDIMNDARNFFPLELDSNHILIISKKEVCAIDSLEKTSENSSKFSAKVYESILYLEKNKQSKKISPELVSCNNLVKNDVSDMELKSFPPVEDSKQNNHHYTKILEILNSSLVNEKRKIDREFDEKIMNIIEHLRKNPSMTHGSNKIF